MKLKQRLAVFSLLFTVLTAGISDPAYAGGENIALIFSGLARTVISVVQLPFTILGSSAKSFPLGIVTGVVQGTAKLIGGTLGGAFDTARGAAPYAKYAALAL